MNTVAEADAQGASNRKILLRVGSYEGDLLLARVAGFPVLKARDRPSNAPSDSLIGEERGGSEGRRARGEGRIAAPEPSPAKGGVLLID